MPKKKEIVIIEDGKGNSLEIDKEKLFKNSFKIEGLKNSPIYYSNECLYLGDNKGNYVLFDVSKLIKA